MAHAADTSAVPRRPGLRERKNRRTQDAIVRATAELTLEHGFEGATIARIAERADVAPRTVSGRFPVKEDILFGPYYAGVARAVQRLREDEGDVVDRLDAWLADEDAWVQADRELNHLRFQAILSDPQLRARETQVLAPIHDALAAAVAEQIGQPADAIGPQMAAAATMGYLHTVRTRQLAGGTVPGEREAGLAFLRAGLAALTQ